MPKAKKITTSITAIEQEMQTSYQAQRAQMVEAAVKNSIATRRRHKPESTIPRQNGKLLFLEPEHNDAIEAIHWTARADRQDVIRTAVHEFLRLHFDGTHLDTEGERLLREYYERTHA